ncbi:hypothetical protein OA416_01685 [Paracoccaceae bacterium]|nr:hypothetical protein [Paracoccaceae bacterium]
MDKINIENIFGSEIKELMGIISSSGKECYIVGGAVRDFLLGHENFIDIDLTTSLSVEALIKIFKKNKIEFDDRAIRYNCLTIRTQKKSVQITSFRKDIRTFGRAADIEIIDNIEEDAKRRDFTINAFYCSLNGEIVDPLGNLEDLNNKELKFIGDPETRIIEDYLRILRFFRFVAVLDLKYENINSKYLPIVKKYIDRINDLSNERVVLEIRKILLSTFPSFALELMDKVNLYEIVLGIYSKAALLKIERLESKYNLTPCLVRRLLALKIQPVIPLLYKKEKKYFNQLNDLLNFDQNPDYLGYKVGEKASLDFLIIKAIKDRSTIKTKDIEKIKNASKKVFPIRFSDVQPFTKSLIITREKINFMESFWIKSGFKASRDELLGLIN